MALTFYQYPKCSTCQKALAWLREQNIAFTAIDLVATPPTVAQLDRWTRAATTPLSGFFNTSGQSYRDGGFKDRLATMSRDEQLAALAADGKLIKRPILVNEDGRGLRVAVGFRTSEAFEQVLTAG
ncbi:MAG: arsenate reductase family protein [Myxococcales bacterium]|nr:MAG: arsenate reductase family protein [Myxococcales bacterium]